MLFFPIRKKLHASMEKKQRHNKPSNSNKLVPHLPEEIITEILTYLPVKTLIKFRSVSKSWLNLISNRKFINTHLVKSCNSGLILNPISETLHKLYSCSLDVINDWSTDISSFVRIDYPCSEKRCRGLSILGSCNGLVCIDIEKVGIFIWNPYTRKSRELRLDVESRCDVWVNYGFGYDVVCDDYKVLRIGDQNQVKIYSLKNNSWRKIESCPHDNIVRNDCGKYVNGVLHWVTTDFGIVSFDLGNEMFGKVFSKPCYDVDDIVSYMVLGVLDGCLSTSCHVSKTAGEGPCIDVWVMQEYGSSDSWVKLFTIPDTTIALKDEVYFPLYVYASGEIVMKTGRQLVVYNSSKDWYRYLKIGNSFHNLKGLEVISCIESLISP